MGSVVTVAMFIGLLYSLFLTYSQTVRQFPALIHKAVGGLVFIAGAWNVVWYASRHITQFWGIAALISGVALMLTGLHIFRTDPTPSGLKKAMPLKTSVVVGQTTVNKDCLNAHQRQ